MKTISPAKLLERLNNEELTILDVRSKDKFDIGKLHHEHAKNVNIFKQDIFNLHEDSELPLSKDEEIIITCTTGNSATKCANILEEHGYDVTLLDGGMVKWQSEVNK